VLTIHFPWGSLLRGVLGHDEAVLRGVAALLAPGARGAVLTSVIARDGVPEARGDLAAVYARHGLALQAARPASAGEVAASRSTWAKRLGPRPVTHFSVIRSAGAC
jgi:16S rRNA (adenine(1408)-N(1))-methyltransferase